ncbi:glycoside hydrolase family 53 protein [Carboxylicivirga linearis]|uniref:Arabinogalactan endo-beta-1,4-galactanase n=1 Tax=Carboxylicivirga linearis TaxID=1628157 RepID=A0ABS5JU86_9BACT|nr:glycosyl hydrolase 53 family protein [Carboxylicivirga linearis]MBS2098474.1 glycosyl hydrolase 53 family protein [Carboxylicivirga linearis]
MKIFKYLLYLLFVLLIGACDDDDEKKPEPEIPPVEDMSGYAKGADVSWLTEMEAAGILFYDTAGTQIECMTLLKSMGMNSIRLRVWVNPVTGWCNKSDLLVKAKRANDLGMRLLIDFHYSDVWADPGTQTKPVEWQELSFDDLCLAVADHTTDILTSLKDWEITPEWIQVGNETGNGMLWEEGRASDNMAQYATLNNCGYDAAKAIFPEVKVIVHLQEGNENGMYRWMFDGLKNNGGKWDVIGMSLYPEVDNWQSLNNDLISNVDDMINRYDCEVMICEVGMDWSEEDACYEFLSDLINRTKDNESCLGIFYWEPQAYGSWKAYSKGAFNSEGKPTKALNAFSAE